MKTYSDVQTARRVLREDGGVLLDLGGDVSTYTVVGFEVAVDMREGDFPRYDMENYWARLGEHGYDETRLAKPQTSIITLSDRCRALIARLKCYQHQWNDEDRKAVLAAEAALEEGD